MRRLVVSGLLLFLGLIQGAFATDYELTIDSSTPSVLKAKSLTVYEQFGLVKPGDRIVSIAEGPLPVPSMSCEVYVGAGAGSTPLNEKGTVPGFLGEVRLGSGDPGQKGIRAALLVHVVAPPLGRKTVITKVGGFFETYPFVWFLIGGGLLFALGVAYIRLIAQPAGTVPIYGKRAYEENIRDVKARLEQILASQEELVKKPPVLRFYRHQIDGFDKRLSHLESLANSSQHTLSGTASGIVDLRKGLDGLATQEKSTRHVIDDLLSKVETSAEEQHRTTEAFRAEAKSQASHLESLAESLAKRLEEQTQKSEEQSKTLGSEVARLQQQLTEANQQIGALRSELDKAETETAGKVQKLGERLESLVPGAVNAISEQVKALSFGLETAQKQSLGVSEQVTAGLEGISGKIASLSKLSEGMSGLNGEIGTLKARIEALGGSINTSTSQTEEFRKELAQTLSAETAQVSQARELLSTLESGITNLREEAARSQAAAEANGAALKGLSGQVEKLTGETATRAQVDSLKEVPNSVTKLEQSLNGALGKFTDAGLSKDDLKAMLSAHQKLTALPEELSQMLQKSLEQKLAGLVAQSLTVTKGKDSNSKDISDHNASILAEVAKQLLVEIEHQKALEQAFANLRSNLEGVPDSIARLEERLESASSESHGLSLDEYEASMAEIKVKLAAIPDAVSKLAARVDEVAAAGGQAAPPLVSNPEIPAKLDKLDERFSSVSAQWEQANRRLDETLKVVAALAASQTVPENKPEPDQRQLLARDVEVPAKEARQSLKEEPVDAQEPLHLVLQENEPVANIETAAEEPVSLREDEPEVVAEVQAEVEQPATVKEEIEEYELAPVDHSPSLFRSTREPAQEWAFAGDISGVWQASSSRALKLQADNAIAIRAMTPTETPGIEYEIGAMLYTGKRILYAHGDSIRAFWPGESERSLLLSHTVPSDPWRLLMLGETLFCVQENRVETIDLASWTRAAAFTGTFTNQCATKELWAGIRKGKPGPALEFRDHAGELVAEALPLPPSFNTNFYMVSDGEAVYVANEHGEVVKATPEGGTPFCKTTSGSLINFLLTAQGPVALSMCQDGLQVTKFTLDGKAVRTTKTKATEISGNVSVLGDRLFFFDAGAQTLCSCDLSSMKELDPIGLKGTERLRRMIALNAGSVQSLLIAGCDSPGKLGSVFLLDPESDAHLTLCSTNQPNVEAIFADGCPVVATSSSYQNIIRVFQPFVAVKSRAA